MPARKPNDPLHTLSVIEVMEGFLQRKRPREEIRHKLDLTYRVEGNDVYICEVRPRWDLPTAYVEHDIAKATYVKAKDHWKVFWLRASGKWQNYPPEPRVDTIERFVRIVEEDKHGCFWG